MLDNHPVGASVRTGADTRQLDGNDPGPAREASVSIASLSDDEFDQRRRVGVQNALGGFSHVLRAAPAAHVCRRR